MCRFELKPNHYIFMDLHRNFNGVIATILFLLLAIQSTAQTKFSFSELKEMKVSGTSTILFLVRN